eukprot:jgi/Botrbrau1/20200/Bobra.0409s0002.1
MLELHAIPDGEGEYLAEAVVELPRLRSLGFWALPADRFMETVVRNASRMTSLQSLEWQAAFEFATVERLATLTQLTSLGLCGVWGTYSQLSQLSCLTSMQVLRLDGMKLSMDRLRQLVSPMRQLQELYFHSSENDAQVRLDPLLACLPMITKLELMSYTTISTGLPASLLPNGFASLRAVALSLVGLEPTGLVHLAEAFTGLESLKLICNGNVAHEFLSHLPCLRSLTELALTLNTLSTSAFPVPIPRWGARSFPWCTSLEFLAELQNLKGLALNNMYDMVDARVLDEGVGYIAALTGLTKVCITQTGWNEQPLNMAQVQPLTTLIWLEQLSSNMPWGAVFDSSAFRGALHGRQYELGLPCTNITLWS